MASRKYFTIPHWAGEKGAGIERLTRHMSTRAAVDLDRGRKVGEHLLDGKVVSLDKELGNQLTDFLTNVDRQLVVSDRARAFFEAQGLGPAELEFVPFRIKDKKGKPLPQRYSIANPLRLVACLDVERSRCRALHEEDEPAYRVSALQIDATKVPVEARLFRLAESPICILIRDDLLAEIRKARLIGLAEQKLGEML